MMGAPAMAQTNKPVSPASITLNQSNPSLGEWVTFTTSYGSAKNPRISAACYQNGAIVWSQLGLVTDSYKLGGDASPWLANGGGPASCEADLVNQVWNGKNIEQLNLLASTEFSVPG
jgi:hypothetical protein